jgi:hypothetical protein
MQALLALAVFALVLAGRPRRGILLFQTVFISPPARWRAFFLSGILHAGILISGYSTFHVLFPGERERWWRDLISAPGTRVEMAGRLYFTGTGGIEPPRSEETAKPAGVRSQTESTTTGNRPVRPDGKPFDPPHVRASTPPADLESPPELTPAGLAGKSPAAWLAAPNLPGRLLEPPPVRLRTVADIELPPQLAPDSSTSFAVGVNFPRGIALESGAVLPPPTDSSRTIRLGAPGEIAGRARPSNSASLTSSATDGPGGAPPALEPAPGIFSYGGFTPRLESSTRAIASAGYAMGTRLFDMFQGMLARAYLFVLSPRAWRDPDPPDLREMAARPPEAFDPPVAALVVRPANGDFDVVVVQSSGTDMIADSARLLTGRPVYTVYVDVGSAKEWLFQYCVPGEWEGAQTSANVVRLPNPAPVQAPYPVLMYRPAFTLDAGARVALVHGFVEASGRISQPVILRGIAPARHAPVLDALSRWEFRPAKRDGVSIRVEFLMAMFPDGRVQASSGFERQTAMSAMAGH